MEYIAPSLNFILNLKFHLSQGDSLRFSLQSYLEDYGDEFAQHLSEFLRILDCGGEREKLFHRVESPYQRALLEIVEQGLRGGAIYERLLELEVEVRWACDQKLEGFFQILPLKSLLPTLFFQIPAYLWLLLGPVLRQLLERMSS